MERRDGEDAVKKHLKYLRYLARHKWFVFVAGMRLRRMGFGGPPIWRLVIHDWSKFMPCEWMPYVDYFYGERERLKNEEPDDFRFRQAARKYHDAFDRAWLHHQHRNPHHYQHWILRNDDGTTKFLYIPDHFLFEMVADWLGAGRAITGKWEAWKWYEKNREHIRMHTQNADHVTKIMKTLEADWR
jgi:hypothetical protein